MNAWKSFVSKNYYEIGMGISFQYLFWKYLSLSRCGNHPIANMKNALPLIAYGTLFASLWPVTMPLAVVYETHDYFSKTQTNDFTVSDNKR